MSESVLKIQKLQVSSNWELWTIRMEVVLTEKGYYNVMTPTDYMETDDYSSEQQAAHIKRQSRGKKAIVYIRLALSDGPLL
jgi:predicted GNAT family N-acyltransferase